MLNCISNELNRFKIFGANCVQMIRNNKNLSQWNYVRSADNPVDSASRGLNTAKEAKIKLTVCFTKRIQKSDNNISFLRENNSVDASAVSCV